MQMGSTLTVINCQTLMMIGLPRTVRFPLTGESIILYR